MTRKIVYLINPISGTKGKSSLVALIKKRTREAAIDFEIINTNAGGDYQFLRDKIKEEKISDVVICGGDGTINAVVNALQRIPVRIGIIPMGSGNGLAFTANIPKQPSKALDIIFRGQAHATDAFYINDEFSCMLCGIGFDASVAHAFAQQKRRGLQTYIQTSFIEFFKAHPFHFEIEVNGKSFQTDAFFICIANSNQFGNNFTIAPKASLSDGLLDVVIVKKMNKLMLPFSLISQVTGINALQTAREYTARKHIIYLQTDSLIIHNKDGAPLHIDGEPRDSSPKFRIRILKHCFHLIH